MLKFAKRREGLVSDTLYFSVLLFAGLWAISTSPFTPISYLFGSVFGLAYSYGLGKYVETLGGTADEAGDIQGAGVGQARFAFLIMLFLLVGKLRVYGLQEIPSISGFFTYQLASLNQGLKEDWLDNVFATVNKKYAVGGLDWTRTSPPLPAPTEKRMHCNYFVPYSTIAIIIEFSYNTSWQLILRINVL